MLDQQTKRNIDSARQILVGKVPDPKAQVEQITTALVYKFMADMDAESEALGGEASFFAEDFSQYEWTKLIDKRLAGQERLELYVQAITNMSKNPSLPQLFRDIFKGAFLPYNDPRTLTLFLKEIDNFSYENSENLGDAFEYLLSILGSQGDAGQFRTPRNIIDFIVETVDPQKNETVLDPACGTAGFLISTYKHILTQNKETPLTPTEKMQLMSNLTGYDISPDMVKLALVNMYLHGCRDPKIHEYDTLTSEARWGDTFAVVLANPPFMTPTGGIIPHSRFEVSANRSEVLFVDYIAEHLRPSGRAGIIVPEGIIFQAANAYKQLRKSLIEDWGLYAVVSLPSGVFQPYSGVKTSVLLLDRALSKKRTDMLFVKVQNDGFSLGAQRQPIDKNDLPAACTVLQQWKQTGEVAPKHSGISHTASKKAIAEGGDYNLTGERYREAVDYTNAKWPMVELGTVCEILTGKRDVNHSTADGDYPFFTCASKQFKSPTYSFDGYSILLPGNGANVGRVFFYDGKLEAYQRTYVLNGFSKNIFPSFIYQMLNNNWGKYIKNLQYGSATNYIVLGSLKKYKIPLPPLEVQEQIAAEIDGYQKVIDGAKQVIANWKPHIKINPNWPTVELGEVCEIVTGKLNSNMAVENGKYPFFTCSKEIFRINTYAFDSKAILLSGNNASANYDVKYYEGKFNAYQRTYVIMVKHKYLNELLYHFVRFIIQQQLPDLKSKSTGGLTKYLTLPVIKNIKVPLPPLEFQEQIIAKIEANQKAVDACKTLATNTEREISDRISEVWNE